MATAGQLRVSLGSSCSCRRSVAGDQYQAVWKCLTFPTRFSGTRQTLQASNCKAAGAYATVPKRVTMNQLEVVERETAWPVLSPKSAQVGHRGKAIPTICT